MMGSLPINGGLIIYLSDFDLVVAGAIVVRVIG
jgi:hypothetical protein